MGCWAHSSFLQHWARPNRIILSLIPRFNYFQSWPFSKPPCIISWLSAVSLIWLEPIGKASRHLKSHRNAWPDFERRRRVRPTLGRLRHAPQGRGRLQLSRIPGACGKLGQTSNFERPRRVRLDTCACGTRGPISGACSSPDPRGVWHAWPGFERPCRVGPDHGLLRRARPNP